MEIYCFMIYISWEICFFNLFTFNEGTPFQNKNYWLVRNAGLKRSRNTGKLNKFLKLINQLINQLFKNLYTYKNYTDIVGALVYWSL